MVLAMLQKDSNEATALHCIRVLTSSSPPQRKRERGIGGEGGTGHGAGSYLCPWCLGGRGVGGSDFGLM
jgi:hypothetical protein